MSSIDTRNRYAGLISGLDTEEMVKSMSALTKNRINSQKQKLQKLQWKQEAYRSIISKISDFKQKYLDILSPTSIKANAIMRKFTATSSNDKIVSATAAAGATPAKYVIKSAQSAKAATVTSNGSAAAGKVALDFSNNIEGRDYTLTVDLDGASKSITFKGGADEAESKQNFLTAVNAAFEGVKRADQGFEFKDGGNMLSFNSADDGVFHTFSIGYNKEGVGLENTAYSRISTSSKLGDVAFAQELKSEDGTYKININGVDFSFTNDTKISEVIDTVNKSSAGVTMSFSNVSQTFKLETKDTGAGQKIDMYQSKGNLLNSLFNIDPSQMQATEAAKGKLTYDGNATAAVKIDSDLALKLKSGFDPGDNTEYKVKITLDGGEEKELTLDFSNWDKPDDGTFDDATISLKLAQAFSEAYQEADPDGELPSDVNISYKNGQIVVSSQNTQVKLDAAEDSSIISGSLDTKQKLTANETYKISDKSEMKFMVDGKEVTVTEASGGAGILINDLVKAGVVKMQSDGTILAAGDISLPEGEVDDDASKFLTDVFGKTSGIQGAKDGDIFTTYGANGTISVSSDGENFTTYTSANNSFTFDGTTFDISNAKDFVAETEDDYITVETSKDTSGLKDVIKGFVEDYNKLLSDLYGETSTSRPKSSGSYYDPLTEEQEEEMSDKEIEKWNENAKTGLLYRDTTVNKFLSELRSTMSKYVDGFGLNDMGIHLTDSWTDNGKLEINESELDSAIATYGDKIADFFTDPDKGLAARLEQTVEKAISTKSKSYGYLTSMAGMENTKTDTDNLIYREMASIQKVIDRLNEKYEAEQERYWKQFSALETYMAQMQGQMSYFTDNSTSSY